MLRRDQLRSVRILINRMIRFQFLKLSFLNQANDVKVGNPTVDEIIVQADHVHGWTTEVGNQNVWNKFDGFLSGVEDSIFSHCAEIALSIDVIDFVKSVFDTELDKSIGVSRINY